MQKRISYYDVDWNRVQQIGGIWLTFDDRTRADLRPVALEELSMLCNMLRAEKPVYYDEGTETLTTQPDRVGE